MKHPTPITVFCKDHAEAERLATMFSKDSRALTSGVGTLKFHVLLAQHGAGEFETLYVPVALKGQFKPPAGGLIKYASGVNKS